MFFIGEYIGMFQYMSNKVFSRLMHKMQGSEYSDKLNRVGMYFKPSGNKVHRLWPLIEQATELAMWPLVDKIKQT